MQVPVLRPEGLARRCVEALCCSQWRRHSLLLGVRRQRRREVHVLTVWLCFNDGKNGGIIVFIEIHHRQYNREAGISYVRQERLWFAKPRSKQRHQKSHDYSHAHATGFSSTVYSLRGALGLPLRLWKRTLVRRRAQMPLFVSPSPFSKSLFLDIIFLSSKVFKSTAFH